jgi:uncharacterized metal-binding protein YceD (DUF177 family)
MSKTAPSKTAFRVADLSQNASTTFEIIPDAATMAGLADVLDLTGLRKLRFVGEIAAHGAADWVLTGELGATVTQPCGVTLAPVTTRIDTNVRRLYLREFDLDDLPEAEMPENDEVERLGAWIDPEAVMVEALSLAVPDYPRAPGVELGEMVLSEPGVEPLTDEAIKPFASLADLKAKMEGGESD